MNFVKRAWIYVKRKWGKVITIGILLFIVSTLILTGLLINSASNSTFEVARNKLGASVTYTTDLSSVMQENRGMGKDVERGAGFEFTLPSDYTQITTKEIEYIYNNSEYVKDYVISVSLAGEPVDFSYFSVSDSSERGDQNNGMKRPSSANINILGVDISSKDTIFNNESNELVEGRYFTDEEIEDAKSVIIIEQTIATLNEIEIGDSITIERQQAMKFEETSSSDSVDMVYEVVGIYKTNNPTDVTSSSFRGAFNLTENTMYSPYTTLLSANILGLEGEELESAQLEIEENGYTVQNVVFNLNNPSDTNNFIEEVENMTDIDTTYRSLNANDSAYQKMVGSIENVASTSKVLVIVVVIAGVFIIGLLSMLSIKDRKYELGVLLSLGESKLKIISQLIIEMLIISIFSFSISALVSNFTAQGVTNYLLNQEIESSESEINNNDNRFGGQMGGFMKPDNETLSNMNVETVKELTVKMNVSDVLKMFGIGVIIIVIGNLVQALFVLRCRPKEIMLEK